MYPRLCLSMVALAAAFTCSTSAVAQSRLTIYGQLDLSLDRVHKSEGQVQGTVFGTSNFQPVPNSVASPAQTQTRLANSLTAQTHLGFKGTEDLGGGWAGKFQLESAFSPDTGSLGSDGRMFGRQAWVGLTTPAGEVRMGRQAAPMLAGFYLNSLEQLGSTDLIGAGVTVNNLQVYQDNMLSYTVVSHGWVGQASYSPNAGVASRISAARATATSVTPTATEATGQIVGGATAGGETSTSRGRTYGALAAYLADGWSAVAAYHSNEFDVPVGLNSAQGFVPLFNVDSYRSYMLGGKYNFAATGTQLAVNYHRGQFKDASGTNPNVATWAFALKQRIGTVDLIAQAAQVKFTNFTRGEDLALMFGADYALSKRTAVYVRAGQLKDRRGEVTLAPAAPLPIGLAGGPAALLVPLGSVELPIFSGAGVNVGATTRLVGFGLRHSF